MKMKSECAGTVSVSPDAEFLMVILSRWPSPSTSATPQFNRTWMFSLPSSCFTRYSDRSEEHTSELQSRQYLVCRLLLEKKTDDRTPELSHQVYDRIIELIVWAESPAGSRLLSLFALSRRFVAQFPLLRKTLARRRSSYL